MDFIDKIRELSARIPKQLDNIHTEEATKHALIMPFISTLGYNVFDPTEVTPELTADVGIKKGEKVDYAILHEGKPVILFECKHHATDLSKVHASQLYRYFNVTAARFGVLTNGLVYLFFTDLEEPNKMDEKPFFEFNIMDIRESMVEELKKFSKSTFDLDFILNTAAELKYTREITRILLEQTQEPADDFVRFFVSKIRDGRVTQAVLSQFGPLVKHAFKLLINDQINERLKSALVPESKNVGSDQTDSESVQTATSAPNTKESAVETTDEEIDGFYIVRAILREVVSPKRVTMRDVQNYCGILLDDTNRKPICRLHFNGPKKFLGLFDTGKEEKIMVEEVDDLYKFADRFKAAVQKYEEKASTSKQNSE